MKRTLPILILTLIFTLVIFTGCNIGATPDTPEDNGERKVILTADEGCEILSESVVTVQSGESVTFDVRLGESRVLSSLSHGALRDADGNVTDGTAAKDVHVVIDSVTEDTVLPCTASALSTSVNSLAPANFKIQSLFSCTKRLFAVTTNSSTFLEGGQSASFFIARTALIISIIPSKDFASFL